MLQAPILTNRWQYPIMRVQIQEQSLVCESGHSVKDSKYDSFKDFVASDPYFKVVIYSSTLCRILNPFPPVATGSGTKITDCLDARIARVSKYLLPTCISLRQTL